MSHNEERRSTFPVQVVAPPACITRHWRIRELFERHGQQYAETPPVIICDSYHWFGMVCHARVYTNEEAHHTEDDDVDRGTGRWTLPGDSLIQKALSVGAVDYGLLHALPDGAVV